MQAIRHGTMLPSLSQNKIASRRPSRDAAHHSGSGWLAKPSPWGTFTSYSLPAFLAHSVEGHEPWALPLEADLISRCQICRDGPCVDVYGPRPIATLFGIFRINGHSC